MATELREAYQHCRTVTRREAKNFYYASITLPHHKREAIYAAYAFCRLCDDAVDEDLPLPQQRSLLNDLRRRLSDAYEGNPDGPVFAALADAARSFHIPQAYFDAVITGVGMDLTGQRYATFAELWEYCYHVACVVGLICIEVFGYRNPHAREYAVDLGLAMQLTNILRDIQEDAERGRVYIPQDELRLFGYSEEELLARVLNDSFRRLMAFQVARARGYFSRGGGLLPLLSPRSRACSAVLRGVYSRLLDRIEAKEYNVFDGRVHLSTPEKLLLTVKIWTQSLVAAGSSS